MVEPLAPVIEWFLYMFSIMPAPVKSFIYLSLTVFLVLAFIGLISRYSGK